MTSVGAIRIAHRSRWHMCPAESAAASLGCGVTVLQAPPLRETGKRAPLIFGGAWQGGPDGADLERRDTRTHQNGSAGVSAAAEEYATHSAGGLKETHPRQCPHPSPG